MNFRQLPSASFPPQAVRPITALAEGEVLDYLSALRHDRDPKDSTINQAACACAGWGLLLGSAIEFGIFVSFCRIHEDQEVGVNDFTMLEIGVENHE